MTSRAAVDEFLGQKSLALVGASGQGKKFGNTIHKELRTRGYRVFPVHPTAGSIDGQPCWPSLADLPEPVGGVVVVVPAAGSEQVVRQAAAAGIRRVWLQQGAQSDAAIRFCEENGIEVIHRECILMFAEPAGLVHRVHRWLWGLLGKLPR